MPLTGPASGTALQVQYPISTVSTMLGIPVPTIRSWERRYGFPAPARTDGKHRRYSNEDLALLRSLRDEISRGHAAREAVDRVVRRDRESSPDAALLVEAFLQGVEQLQPDDIRSALERAEARMGLDAALQDVLFPAMHQVGDSWQLGRCDVAAEHLATQAAHTWLGQVGSRAAKPFRPSPVVLACGPKDLHSLGIEAFAVLLARRGWDVRVLGPQTPIESLLFTARASEAVAAIVVSQSSLGRRSAVDALRALEDLPRTHAFYAGGAFTASPTRRDISATYLGEDLQQAAIILEDVTSR